MEQEIKVEPSEDLAYWVGVAQSDGSYRAVKASKRIEVGICEKSLPMLLKFYEISKTFKRDSKGLPTKRKDGTYRYYLYGTALFEKLQKLGIDFRDPPKPPKWTLEKLGFFGAYLAGVIDGDGDIRIKRPNYPQCAIRITSGTPQIKLQDAIEKKLKCGTSIIKEYHKPRLFDGRLIQGIGYRLEFLVSSKTIDFIKELLLPWIQISHKREKIKHYLMIRGID